MIRPTGVTFFRTSGLALTVLAATLAACGGRPAPVDFTLAGARALLDGGRPVESLDIVSGVVEAHPDHAGARTLLGIVLFRMHLYHAALEEFQRAQALDSGLAEPEVGVAYAELSLRRPTEAAAAASRAVELDPASIDAWVILARARWALRDFRGAEQAALEARRLDAENPVALEALLRIYLEQGAPDQFRPLIDEAPRENENLRDLVVTFLIRQGEFRRAWEHRSAAERRARQLDILRAERRLLRSPAAADELYPQLIRDLVAVGDFARALQYGARYRGSEPIDLELGKAFWMAGDLENARRRFEAASRNGVHKLSAEIALAVLEDRAEHLRRAFTAEHPKTDYFILSRLEPWVETLPPALRPLVWRYVALYEPSYYEKAVAEGVRLEGEESRDLDLLLTMGAAYERLGRTAEAERYYGRARDAYPAAAEPLARLAVSAIRQGDAARGAELLEQALARDPGDAGNLFNLGWLYDQLGDDEAAMFHYARSAQASPLSFDAMNNLALIYRRRDEPARALELLERAAGVDPASEAVYMNLAEHYSSREDWRSALRFLDRVLELNPVYTEAWLERGRVYLRSGGTEAALESFNTALGLDASLYEAYVLAAAAYERRGQVKAAWGAAREARRLRPDEPEVQAMLVRLQEVVE